MINGLVIILSIILTHIGLYVLKAMFLEAGVTEKNYLKNPIPNSMGVLFMFVNLINLSCLYIFKKDETFIVALLAIVTMGFVGFLDDQIGITNIKGLKGHIKAFFKGNLTTGMLKALTGSFMALIISIFIGGNYFLIILNIISITLSINLCNLFDLRPGRTSKLFILVSLVLLRVSFNSNVFTKYNIIIIQMLFIIMVYIRDDLKANIMMGDTGSNILGVILGVYSALIENIVFKIAYVSILIIIHMIAERVSISKVIKNNKILNYLDMLGR